MMVRSALLIVSFLSAFVAVSMASAQPLEGVGPWSTLEQVNQRLRDRQERSLPPLGGVESSSSSEGDWSARQPLLMGSVRLIAAVAPPTPTIDPGPVLPAVSSPTPETIPAPSPAPERVVPYKPLVLGSLFSMLGSANPIRLPVVSPSPASAPEAAPAPSPSVSPAPVSAPPVSSPPVSAPPESSPFAAPAVSKRADAFLNFTDGFYAGASDLVTGTPGPWQESPVVGQVFGGTPSQAQRSGFEADVLAKVEENFRQSGLDVDLTTEPGSAAHTLSVVSGALARDNPSAIGIADIGGDGFTFLDAFDPKAITSVDSLENAVANNISHELMHAFGVDFHDASGQTIDSGTIRWDLLTRDDLAFSADAVALLASKNFQERWDALALVGLQQSEHGNGCACHSGAMATPEPTTWVMWTLALGGAVWSGRRYRRGRVAS
ncbi:PEP-CTERM sorting domain-containing protein [Tautonia sociabilis]|uniref:PEP-CTERM sorting domain-containing protein n=1 Tax=Tautonia sociabilis TaxID=2080755 RepID=UPI0013158C12|nr:PEP-CTERM sorting domain-containing protein [Tautonia sociabilis]